VRDRQRAKSEAANEELSLSESAPALGAALCDSARGGAQDRERVAGRGRSERAAAERRTDSERASEHAGRRPECARETAGRLSVFSAITITRGLLLLLVSAAERGTGSSLRGIVEDVERVGQDRHLVGRWIAHVQ
jgi:hypothetical protein